MTPAETKLVASIEALIAAAAPSPARDAIAADLASLTNKHASGEYAAYPTDELAKDLAHLEGRARALATGGEP